MRAAAQKCAQIFEKLLYDHPQEYLWSYKVFKYSTQAHICILDDGKTGHLRQSQAFAQELEGVLRKRDRTPMRSIVNISFQSRSKNKLFQVFAFGAMYLRFLRKEEFLSFFLTETSYQSLLGLKPDYIISCASSMGSLNFFLKSCYSTKSFCILRAGLIPWNKFDFVTAPVHDQISENLKCPVVRTKAALNLITPGYLKTQTDLLLNRYSHLKNNVRTKIGVLLGGDTKGVVLTESMVKALLRQIKEAALYFNADILITTSRRTSVMIDGVVVKELKGFERLGLMIIANEENPPEAVGGILGLADIVIVSGESISMVSEAVSSGKPTIVFTVNSASTNKYSRFVHTLSDSGYVFVSEVKDVANAIQNVRGRKVVLNKFDDRKALREAIEGMM